MKLPRWFLPLVAIACLAINPSHAQRLIGREEKSDLAEYLRIVKETPPLKFSEGAITQRQWAARFEAWAKKKFSAAMTAELNELGIADAALASDQLLRRWVNAGGISVPNEATRRITKAIPVDAAAPVTQFFAAVLAMRESERAECRARFRTCIKETTEGRGSLILAMLSSSRILVDPSEPKVEDEDRCVELVASVLEKEKFSEDEVEFLVYILNDRIASEARKRLAKRLLEIYENSSLAEWARLHLAGLAHLDLNYQSGMASESPQTAREERVEHLRMCRKALERSWELRPDRPESPVGLINVSQLESYYHIHGDDSKIWFERAIAANLDNEDAYRHYIYGTTDPKAAFAFGVACAKSGRSDTRVPEIFFRTLDKLDLDLSGLRSFMAKPEVSKLTLKLCQDSLNYALKSKDPDLIEIARVRMASSALLMGENTRALEQLAFLKNDSGELEMSPAALAIFSDWNIDCAFALHDLRLQGSPAKRAWQKGIDARMAGDFAAALAAADDAIKLYPAEKVWLEGWKELAAFERDYDKSEDWLRAPKGAAAWHFSVAQWKWRPNGDMEARMGGGMTDCSNAALRARLGEHYEIRGKFQVSASRPRYSLGLMVGLNPRQTNRHQSIYVLQLMQLEGKQVFPLGGVPPRPYLNSFHRRFDQVEGQVPNTFRFQRDGSKLNVWVNDRHSVQDLGLGYARASDEDAASLFAYVPNNSDPIVISDLEIRRLPKQ